MTLAWSPSLGRWVRPKNGRTPSRPLRSREMDRLARKAAETQRKKAMASLSKLKEGDISFLGWQQQTAEAIRRTAINAIWTQNGGHEHTDGNTYLEIGRYLKTEYGYLRALYQTMAQTGTVDERKLTRSLNRYINRAAKVGRNVGRSASAKKRGHQWEIRVLQAGAKHCAECIQYAAMGVQPIGTLPKPSERCRCGSFCLCSLLSAVNPQDLERLIAA